MEKNKLYQMILEAVTSESSIKPNKLNDLSAATIENTLNQTGGKITNHFTDPSIKYS